MKYELNLAEKYDEGERAGFSMGMAEGISQGEAIGLSKGRSEGISKGIAEEKRRMVRSFKEQGVPLG